MPYSDHSGSLDINGGGKVSMRETFVPPERIVPFEITLFRKSVVYGTAYGALTVGYVAPYMAP